VKGTPANGVFEKWDKQDIQKITGSSIQPASSLHPLPQQYQGLQLSLELNFLDCHQQNKNRRPL